MEHRLTLSGFKAVGHFPMLPDFSLFPSFLAALLSSPTTFKFMVIFYEKKDSYRFCWLVSNSFNLRRGPHLCFL